MKVVSFLEKSFSVPCTVMLNKVRAVLIGIDHKQLAIVEYLDRYFCLDRTCDDREVNGARPVVEMNN